jgi:hypothetical protein
MAKDRLDRPAPPLGEVRRSTPGAEPEAASRKTYLSHFGSQTVHPRRDVQRAAERASPARRGRRNGGTNDDAA